MEQPPPSEIMLQGEASSAPPFFQPISAASILNGMLRAYQSNPQAPLTTGISSIDSHDGVLGGGIPQGCVIGISSDLSEGSGRILALRLLIRDLLHFKNRHKRAIIIDSTGTFPLLTLLEVIKGCVGEISDGTTKTASGQRMPWREKVIVERLLDRIGITRVFDLEGVWDVLGEIRTGRDGQGEIKKGGGEDEEGGKQVERGNGGSINERQEMEQESVEEYRRVMSFRLGGGEDPVERIEEQRETREESMETLGQSVQHDILKGHNASFQDTQLAQRAGTLRTKPSPPEKVAPPTSSPLTPPPPVKEPETSSPLSSLPASPSPPRSVSSSSLRSELIIEPSPVKGRTNTVMSQAYQGETLPPSIPSSASPSSVAAVIFPSPLPPSSPPVMEPQAPIFAPPTEGFETHLATDAVRKDDKSDLDIDTDSSSDTSSYLRGEHPSPSRNKAAQPPASQWQDAKSAPPPSILLVDSLPTLITQLFGNGTSDRTMAHRELSQLSRVLVQMSRSMVHSLAVVLLNSTTAPNAAKSRDEHLIRSVFEDTKAVPSFGAVYDGMVDITLLVSKVPRTHEDAEALYGGYGACCSYTNVVECLRDDTPDLARWMEEEEVIKGKGRMEKRVNREGRWGRFNVLRMDGEAVIRDPDLGRRLGRYEDVGFGRRP